MIIGLTVIFLFLDVLSKVIISNFFEINESITIINKFFRITYVKNTGAAFSILDSNIYLVIGISSLIIGSIVWYILKCKPKNMIEKIGYSMVLGGALGNFLNRIIYGYVVDFIDINLFGWNYPIFNIADILIVLGVIFLMIDTWRNGRNGN